MTKRECVYAAINHKKTDLVPYHIRFTKDEHDDVAAYLGDHDFESEIGNYVNIQWYSEVQTETAPGSMVFKDSFGVCWDKSSPEADIGIVSGVLLKNPDLSNYRFPQPDEAGWRKKLEDFTSQGDDTFKCAGIGFTLYDRAWTLRGTENFLVDMYEEPAFVEQLLDEIVKFDLQLIDIAAEYDVDAIHFADDWGQQSGMIMGPDLWRKYLKPRMKILYDRVKIAGKIVTQHVCGNIVDIFPDLVEIGLDVYQSLQPEVYDLKRVKSEFGDKLCFWGGIGTQHLLPYTNPAEIERTVNATLELMGENGGYIAGPAHAIVRGTPPANVVALINVLKHQQRG